MEQARSAWATASRDSELDRWRDLYDAAVPRPRGCPAAAACESCAAPAGLAVEEADTPVGVICLTLRIMQNPHHARNRETLACNY